MARRGSGGRRWTATAKQRVRTGARRHESTASIARAVRRTKAAVRAQASRMHVSLMPKDS